jgi:hypothetical protein
LHVRRLEFISSLSFTRKITTAIRFPHPQPNPKFEIIPNPLRPTPQVTHALYWLFVSDRGLGLRIILGALFFLTLALLDLRRHGPRATRWREYLFILAAAAIAMAYGVINDLITSRISWEYYAYGKGLAQALGDREPPDPARLAWEAAKVGLKATWTVGLIAGVALAMANNPRPGLPRLAYRTLLRRMPMILLITATGAAILGTIGALGYLTAFSDEFRAMVRLNEWRPHRFMAVFGIHLGGYVGGTIGIIWAVLSIRRQRRFATRASLP